jgi:hypothetical protein
MPTWYTAEHEPRNQRDRWFNAEYQVALAEAQLSQAEHLSDRLPIFNPNMGPEIAATLLGCELEFSATTSWAVPRIEQPEDEQTGWPSYVGKPLDWENPYWRAIERMTELALQRGKGKFVVGITDLHGSYDTLASLRDPEELCVDVLECPELVDAAGRDLSRVFVEAFQRSWAKIQAAGQDCCTCWMGHHSSGPAYPLSCDFWCMVGPEVARDLILPTIKPEAAPLDRSIFHLDGPQAHRHLDLLLAWPELDAVQWVYGAGNGPAGKWVDTYRRCLAAGKRVQVIAESIEDALGAVDALGPKGVWLMVGEAFEDAESARAFLKALERRSAGVGA